MYSKDVPMDDIKASQSWLSPDNKTKTNVPLNG
jgi:hypothetical protein